MSRDILHQIPIPPLLTSRRFCIWFGLALVVIAGHCVRVQVKRIHDEFKPMLGSYGRLGVSINDAERILAGEEISSVFETSTAEDDKGLSLLTTALLGIAGLDSRGLNRDAKVELVLSFIHYLDLVTLIVFTLALRKTLGTAPSLLFGLAYTFYLPSAIANYRNETEIYLLSADLSLLTLSAILLIPDRSKIQIPWVFLLSVFCIFATLVRSSARFFPPLLAVCLWLKFGRRKGTVLAALLLIPYFLGHAALVTHYRIPSHPIWHAVYVGLGQYPNPFGIQFTDQQGTEASLDVRNKDVNQWHPDEGYFDVVKGRALTHIDEAPGFWMKTLIRRTWLVLFGEQDWEFYSLGLASNQARSLTWVIFLLGLLGIFQAVKDKRRDMLFLLMAFVYHTLIFVPIAPGKPPLYLCGSIVQLALACYFLSRQRVETLSGLTAPTQSSTQHWETDPFDRKFILSAVLVLVIATVGGVGASLYFAKVESQKWREGILNQVSAWKKAEDWKGADIQQLEGGSLFSTPAFDQVEKGNAFVFHTRLNVKRGRLGLQAKSINGEPLSKVTYTTTSGSVHAFVGWISKASEPCSLHIWDAIPSDPMLGDGADPESVEAAMEAYRHFGIQDSAKYDFSPGNSITVSDSLFPNGHERIPFVLDKRIPIGGGKTLPLYWCAPFPFKVRLKWTEPREITQIFITSKGERCPAEISYSGPNEPIAAPLPVVHQEFSENERLHETRYISRPTLANEILLVFQGEKGKHGYITDVSIPDRADFEWVETTLHVVGSEQSVEGFPTRLSFGSPN